MEIYTAVMTDNVILCKELEKRIFVKLFLATNI